jgi:predicted amidohydrolase YtcJ
VGLIAVLSLYERPALARHADIVLYNGRIFTSNESALWAEALAIRDDFVVAVGRNEDVLKQAGKSTRLVDLTGRLVVPGFNDAHVHTTPYGLVIGPTNFAPGAGPSTTEMLEYIRTAVGEQPAGTWLTGIMGEAMLGDPGVNRSMLDDVAPNHPVLLMYWWGHGTVINTAGMRAAGISETAPDPEGGWYGRVEGTNTLDGTLHEYAGFQLSRQLADQMPIVDARAKLIAFAMASASLGITSLQDMSFNSSGYQQQVFDGVSLPVRIRNICFPLAPGDTCAPVTRNQPGSAVTWTGFKRILDGALVSRGAALDQPYSDSPNEVGRLNFSAAFLRSEMLQSWFLLPAYGQRISHVVGDRTVDFYLDVLDATAPACVWQLLRPRLEHGRLALAGKISRLRDHGMVMVQNPAQFASPDLLIKRLGPERFSQAGLSATLLHAGIPIAIGSDVSGQPLSPLVELMLAVINPINLSEGLTLEEAVIAHTRGSAYAEFEEYRKGTLAPGMLADLAVLSNDIFKMAPNEIAGAHVVLTMVGGKVVFATGELAVP